MKNIIKFFRLPNDFGFRESPISKEMIPSTTIIMKKNTCVLKSTYFLTLLFVILGITSYGQNPADGWTLTSTPAPEQDSYTLGSNTYIFGQGNNIEIETIIFNGNTFTIPFSSQFYVFNRVDIASNDDGVSVVGNKASMFFETTGISDFIYNANLPGTPGNIDLEEILRSTIINRGALDVFKNTGTNGDDQGPQNIERIDVVFPELTIDNAADLPLNGFLATEKSGNNTYKAAAILSIDAAGVPTSFGNLVTMVADVSFGRPADDTFNPVRQNAFLEDSNSDNQPIFVRTVGERAGISIITFADLGISAGQTFYGISYFGDDVDDTDNLLDPSSFPNNTTTGADIYGALGAIVTATGFEPPLDSDGDLVIDSEDLDDDNDGILDTDEGLTGILLPNLDGESSVNSSTIPRSEMVSPCAADLVTIASNKVAFDFRWNNASPTNIAEDGDPPMLESRAIYTLSINETEYLRIETPTDGGNNADDATEFFGNAIITPLNNATFTNSLPSTDTAVTDAGQNPQNYIDHTPFRSTDNALFATIVVSIPQSQIITEVSYEADLIRDDLDIENFSTLETCAIDTDGDTIPNFLDTDSDNDGCPDAIEAAGTFTAADLTEDNSLTNDSSGVDDDGVPTNTGSPQATSTDVTAAGPDADSDGIADACDDEFNDVDGDGVADAVDLDADNDGIPDTEENIRCITATDFNTPNFGLNTDFASSGDADLDGFDNGTFDFAASLQGSATWRDGVQIQNDPAIGDYIFTQPENTGGTNTATYVFTFPTAVSNFSFVTGGLNNNDQLTFTASVGGVDIPIGPDNFGNLVQGIEVSGNSVTGTVFDFSLDPLINVFTTIIPGLVDTITITARKSDNVNTQVTVGMYSFGYCVADETADFDGDGIINSLDLDSDNDGITDIVEAGGIDTNNDGEVDYPTPGDPTSMTDTDANGLEDGVEATPLTLPNSDALGGPDWLDIDADNDGIPDNVEAQLTSSYVPPSGTGAGITDSNLNGVDDAYESGANIGITPENTDGDMVPDYIDDDSDDDGIFDIVENGNTANSILGVDIDGDGLDDNFDNTDDSAIPGATVNDNINPPNASNLGDEDGDLGVGGDVDYRDVMDYDGDGVADLVDLDDDNDGIPDVVENPTGIDPSADDDGDGVPNYLDDDSSSTSIGDDDGFIEFGFDFDQDGVANHLDLDSDNDGVHDVLESGGTDDDTDGTANDDDNNVDNTGSNGIPTSAGAAGNTPIDTGADDSPDYLNLDSDADGCTDADEAYASDTADGGDGGQFGTGIPAATGAFGLVTAAPYNTGVVASVTDATDTSACDAIDLDGDGINDAADLDDDNDGILDTEEGTVDTDGDGIIDAHDLDSDNDGVPDIVEAGGIDTDGDGRLDYPTPGDPTSMVDANSDGLDDSIAATPLPDADSDDDGIVDRLDLDADNDGIPDVTEAGGPDADGDGTIDAFVDADNDGFADSVDSDDDTILGIADGGTPLANPDTDNDGVDDRIDVDSDNDGITDVTEAGGTDADGDGRIDGFVDADTDGFTDNIDTDDNTTPAPLDGSGTALPRPDFDSDGQPNYLDIDSDNDGITDTTEAGGADTDGNGEIDGFTDTDGDGFDDATTASPLPIPNTDSNPNDGPDYLDIDADDDGLPDNIEAQPTVGYIAPNGTSANNGLDDAYTTGFVPEDTDGDSIPDYLDSDSDNDGIEDLTEGGRGAFSGSDTDGDGLDDGFEGTDNNDPFDVNDEIDDPTTLPDLQLIGGDVDYRQGLDSDGDGVTDDQEIADGTDPNNPCDFVIASITETQGGDYLAADCDGDGVTNETEIADGTNPEDSCDFIPTSATLDPSADYLIVDCDGDGVTNGTELADGTDPNDACDFLEPSVTLDRSGDYLLADCDGDQISNGQEISDGTNPEDPCSNIGGTSPTGAVCDIIIDNDLVGPQVDEGFFRIQNIESFENNTVRIYNRWGILVFETQGYDNATNVFTGVSSARVTIRQNEALPAGVYFYIVQYENNGEVRVKDGYLYVNR